MAKDRSPNYPALGLPEAIQIVGQLWNKERRTSVSHDVAAKAIGYKGMSGPARTKLSVLKKYGLVDDDRNGIRVSELAISILVPPNDADREQAIRTAALKPDLFRELHETHPEASDAALTSVLVRRGFSDAGARAFIDAFRATIALAKLEASGYTPSTVDKEPEAMTATTHHVSTGDAFTAGDSSKGIAKPVRVYSWPLPNDTLVELRFTGGPITQEHIEMLRHYLELVKGAVPKATEGD